MNRNEQEYLVQQIKTKYTEKEFTQLDELKKLDAQVNRPANIFAYTFGILSAIVMGAGMSLVMTDIGAILGLTNTLVPGIVVGVIGLIGAIVNYPLYKKILDSRKKKYADKIIALSDEIMNQ